MRSFALALITYVATAAKLTSLSKAKTKNAAQLKCHDCHRYPSPEKLLAQIDLEAKAGISQTCTTTFDRLKKDPVDFWKFRTGTEPFTDADFPADGSSISWPEMQESDNSHLTWTRAGATFPEKTLFGDGISYDDINQGGLGNCWALSAASAVAEKPERLIAQFINTENVQNKAGIYGMNMYALGVPTSVVIDDYLVTQGSQTIFTDPGTDKSMWVPFFEKALAKFHGNFLHTDGGWPTTAV